ncbi:MAG: VOC family protein [Chloroflexi bacterium]|nr:VOC family protein [Chloroflexota bacterium]MDA1226620.1 VOC family protein [Chloroflexota bacterium]
MREQLTVSGMDHAAFVVRDLAESKRWYAEMFGFAALDPNAGPSSPYIGNATTKLALLEENQERTYVAPVGQGPRACHIAFGTDAVTFVAYQQHLKDRQIDYEKLVHADCQSIYFSDPDGYLLEVTTYEIDGLG